jgi:hypothetical protein
MVRGEEYPLNFKEPREVEKYNPKQDPVASHTELLATRYLPLLVDGNTR